MSVTINNLESDVTLTGGGSSPQLNDNDLERIAMRVMEKIREEQELMARVREETAISNSVSVPDTFD
jgi:hypothetical protein